MILSIWRYSHLVLALSSSIFVLIATLTGVILAFEPIGNQIRGYDPIDLDEVRLATTLEEVRNNYEEVFSIEVDQEGFVIVSALDAAGDMVEHYIHPATGEKVGDLVKQHPTYEFATALHRSLFLKTTGRFFVGLSSFLLLLIACSGLILIIKKQQGIRHFFDKLIKESFFQHYHTYLGRLALIPIIIITITGTYLSLVRFELIPETISTPVLDTTLMTEVDARDWSEFSVFKETRMAQVRKVEFPFSPDVEDLFIVHLRKNELHVNQHNGQVVGKVNYPFTTLLASWSMILHTGRGSISWSIILLLSSLAIIFFMYSGFKITLQRRSSRIKNSFAKDICDYIILAGSETGSTITFAMQLHRALLERGIKSYITEPNRFTRFSAMKHLVMITSTYGVGDPPANSNRFLNIFKSKSPANPFSYSIVGFGSLAYPDFCKYAYQVDDVLMQNDHATRLSDVHTVNNKSWESFRQWAIGWGEKVGVQDLVLPAKNPLLMAPRRNKTSFRILAKSTISDHGESTFLLILKPEGKLKHHSGDLLGVYPPEDPHERLYSMSICDGEVLLAVKFHEKGICSRYLSHLVPGENVSGRLIDNKHFHFPKNPSEVIMISTGTGIAPFLGMLAGNQQMTNTRLYWGGRTSKSFLLYQPLVRQLLTEGKLAQFHPAFSREDEEVYVQYLLDRDRDHVGDVLRRGGVIMICGSIAMQKEVVKLLEDISSEQGKPLSYYQKKNQLRIDCY